MNIIMYQRKKNSVLSTILVAITMCLILTGCNVNISSSPGTGSASSGSTSGNNTGSGGTSTGTTTGTGAQGVQVFVEPDAGDQVITSAINSASKSIWLEMYLLTDRKVISALEEAAHRGIDVRVMLEGQPYGSSGSSNPHATLDRLSAAGVQAKTTSPRFALTHEKGMIIDGETAYIMTANFTLSALGGSSTTRNREYGIIDKNPQDVQTVQDIFNADWNRSSVQINNPNLVVSPLNSRSEFTALIASAKKTLQVEAEEMQDSAIEQALIDAEHRGVQVQIILPQPQSSSGDAGGSNDANSQGINTIKRGGIEVKEDPQLYMHAKIMIADGQRAFVGSENISTSSLERNRELGIIVSDQTVLVTLQQTFQQDWSVSQAP